MIRDALMELTPREERVIIDRLYYGKTLNQIGLEFGVHRERIRQIEEKALIKLTHPRRRKMLTDNMTKRKNSCSSFKLLLDRVIADLQKAEQGESK